MIAQPSAKLPDACPARAAAREPGDGAVRFLLREGVLEELPDLTADDIAACLRFARQRLDHPVDYGRELADYDNRLARGEIRW